MSVIHGNGVAGFGDYFMIAVLGMNLRGKSMAGRIHPTSEIDSQADLAEDVSIGPGCVIRGCVRSGAGTRVIGHAYLQGPLTIGRENTIYPFTTLGFAPQDRKYNPLEQGAGVLIGDGNVFRESVTIHRATGQRPTTIGDGNYFMVNSHAGHDVVMGDDNMLANGALLAGHVEVADRVIFGGNCAVHQFCRVGRLVMMSGQQGVTRDLPPFSICYEDRRVGGLNLVGLRRAGYRDHIPALKEAFTILYRNGHANLSAVDLIERELGNDTLCMELVAFVRTTSRGITGYRQPIRDDA